MKIFKSLNKRKLVVLHKKCRVFYTEWLCARFINKSSNGNTDFNPIKDLDLRKKTIDRTNHVSNLLYRSFNLIMNLF